MTTATKSSGAVLVTAAQSLTELLGTSEAAVSQAVLAA
jgi:hypothetical protein